MNRVMLAAVAVSLGIGASVALAEGSPEFNRPFTDRGIRNTPVASGIAGGPVLSDADARARLQADGYRAIADLSRGNDGAWRGTAIRGAAKLTVTVDQAGRILAR